MGLYTILVALYVGLLLFVRPAPQSFRDSKISIKENFFAIKGSLFIGVLLLSIHLYTGSFELIEADDSGVYPYALYTIGNESFRIYQFFTQMFVHFNLIHLIGNVVMIGMLSAYERRVGLKRYLIVFFLSGLVSGLSILFYTEDIASMGASGAVFGLAAAFFTDDKSLSLKDWIYAIIGFVLLASLLTLKDWYEIQKIENINFSIDYIAHALGALAAIVYTRLTRVR